MASAQYAKTLLAYVEPAGSASVPTVCDSSPLMPDTQAFFRAPASTTVYGVNLPTKSFYPTNAKYLKVVMPAEGTVLDSTAYPALLNANVAAAASMNTSNVLRVVLKVNGTIWARVASDAIPQAGEFNVSGTDPIALTFGASVAAGSLIEVYMNDAADIVAIAILAAGNVTQQAQVKEVMAATAIAVVEAF